MVSTISSSLYEEVVRITRSYFGPAARRFVDRQIVNHLDIQPEKLRKQDLIQLIDWMGLAMATLVEDKTLISDFSAHLRKLVSK